MKIIIFDYIEENIYIVIMPGFMLCVIKLDNISVENSSRKRGETAPQ